MRMTIQHTGKGPEEPFFRLNLADNPTDPVPDAVLWAGGSADGAPAVGGGEKGGCVTAAVKNSMPLRVRSAESPPTASVNAIQNRYAFIKITRPYGMRTGGELCNAKS